MADTSTTGQKVAAEVIGTFVLVFFGCGTAIVSGVDYAATGLAFGLTVVVGAYAFGRVSGAHFNPAVSVGAAMSGRMAWHQVPLYVGSQLVGALAAGLSLLILMQGFDGFDVGRDGLAQNSFGDAGSGYALWSAFLLEMLLTAVFLWVILAVTDARNEHPAMAPMAIGLALAMIHFASIGATGTSVNPARSIGVGLFAGTDAVLQLWLFILAPLVGATIAGLSYPLLFGHGSDPVPGSGFKLPARPARSYAAPGYGAPDQFQQEWNQRPTAAYPEPIIENGWQWDYAAQEWKPLEQYEPPAAQTQPSGPAGPAPAEQPTAQMPPTGESVPEQTTAIETERPTPPPA
jgi:aquaporin Z